MSDDWTEEQIKAGSRIVMDGVAVRGHPAEVIFRPGEREKRESDAWRWAKKVERRLTDRREDA